MQSQKLLLLCSAITLAACSPNQPKPSNSDEFEQKIKKQEELISLKQQEIEALSEALKDANDGVLPESIVRTQENLAISQSSPAANSMSPLLPPNAKTGECYARVWAEPIYENETKTYVSKEASKKLEVKPAEYEWVEEKVLIKEASEEKVPVAAQYGFEEEQVQISEATRLWRTKPYKSAPLVNDGILDAAKRGGIDLDNAPVNTCYHEHFKPAKYEDVTEQVLISEASEKVVSTEPVYETVEEKVLVKEESKKLVTTPAVYETVTEKVVDKPAHQVWKKGTGPIQKINEATGEIMCLVDVPATYKTITRQVLKTPAKTEEVIIPAEYKMVKVRKIITPAKEERIAVPAQYKTLTKSQKVQDGEFIWHIVSDNTMSKASRTGPVICLVEEPAQFKTVKRKIVTKKAGFETKTIPAQYDTIKVRKLVKAAETISTDIPAEEKTVTQRKLVKEGQMEWRSILCDTNMTAGRLSAIQQALKDKGYNPGPIDGVIGSQTMNAVNKFQSDNELPVDQFLNIQTLNALGVAAK